MGATRNTSGSVEPPDEPDRESGIAFASAESAPAESTHDKRRFARCTVTMPVRMTNGDGESFSGHCVNLSRGGMYVEVSPNTAAPSVATPAQLVAGAPLRIWLALDDGLPNSTNELFLTGEVRWLHAQGVGIQHTVLASSDTVRLADFLASQQIANPQTSE